MRKDLPVALFLFSPSANSFVLCQISKKHQVDSTDSLNTCNNRSANFKDQLQPEGNQDERIPTV